MQAFTIRHLDGFGQLPQPYNCMQRRVLFLCSVDRQARYGLVYGFVKRCLLRKITMKPINRRSFLAAGAAAAGFYGLSQGGVDALAQAHQMIWPGAKFDRARS